MKNRTSVLGKHKVFDYFVKLFIFRKIRERQLDKPILRIYVYSMIFLILLFWIVSIPILFFVYIGIIIYRKEYFQKIGKKIRSHINRKFNRFIHLLIAFLYLVIIFIVLFLLIVMIFPIPILILILIGYHKEKKYFESQNKSLKTFVCKYSDYADKDLKKQSTTTYFEKL